LRALFSGGTLAYELLLGLQPFLAVRSNIATQPAQKLADVWRSEGHTVLDLGEDEFTQGRLHPMMDNDLRLRRLRQEAADPAVGLILLDVVMPRKNGYEVLAAVRQSHPSLKVVLMSGYNNPAALPGAKNTEHQADAAIQKPFDWGDLERVMQSVLEAKSPIGA
jgi:CheY-like chemotaxis protein